MTVEEMKRRLENRLKPRRFIHSVNVMQKAAELSKLYGADEEKARVAGLLHDCARDLGREETFSLCRRFGLKVDNICSLQPELLHGPVGACLAREEYGVTDEDVINAIYWHTTGCSRMPGLTSIIFIADYIEPGRIFPGVDEVRRTAEADLQRAIIMALDMTINYVVSKGTLLHPYTVEARNYLLMPQKQELTAGDKQ